MRRHRKALAAAVAAGGIGVAAVLGTPTSATAAGTVHGCPHGAVCIYPRGAGWNGNRPSVEYWSYGVHNLSNQLGYHYVLNNQYDECSQCGWAVVALFTGYNATGTVTDEFAPYDHQPAVGASWANVNLTPINSISMWVVGP